LAFLKLRSKWYYTTGIMALRSRRARIVLPKPEQCQIFTSGRASEEF